MSFSVRKSKRVSIDFKGDKGLTEQHHKDSCDIHTIMRKYEKTGALEHTAKYGGSYMDFPNSMQFHECMNIVAEAASMFETVPAKIRAKFGNDPAAFLDFMQDNKNYDEIEEMGLDPSYMQRPVEEKPTKPAEPAKPVDESNSSGKAEPAGEAK